tara:strand:+ start:198 stop:497 length:300 start_codon:yes stop_codon:yes gene_type:complete
MKNNDYSDELGIGHENIKIRSIYIIFFFVFLAIGLILIGINVTGSVFGILGLVFARIVVGFFFKKKTDKEKEEEDKKNSKYRLKKMFENNSNTFGSSGL